MAQFETIENGARAHGVNVVQLLKELNNKNLDVRIQGSGGKNGEC